MVQLYVMSVYFYKIFILLDTWIKYILLIKKGILLVKTSQKSIILWKRSIIIGIITQKSYGSIKLSGQRPFYFYLIFVRLFILIRIRCQFSWQRRSFVNRFRCDM